MLSITALNQEVGWNQYFTRFIYLLFAQMTNSPSFKVFVFIFYGEVMTDCIQLNKAVKSN